MTIKRGGIAAILSGKTEHEIEYCQHCLDVANIRVRLGKRIYLPDEFGNVIIPPDDDNWRQCYECGRVFPIYELKKESVPEDFAEASENPFELNTFNIAGVGESRKFIRNRNNSKLQYHIRNKKRLQQNLSQYKDEDVKAALGKGAKLVLYHES